MPAQLHIYSGDALDRDLSELEADLESWLGNAGEITGTGSGRLGWNIDVELADGQNIERCVAQLFAALSSSPVGVPRDTYFRVFPPVWVEGTGGRLVQVYSA